MGIGREHRTWVYPRTGGGTGGSGALTVTPDRRRGLSPHGRGNPACAIPCDELPGPGSIPARAGEPPATKRSREPGVYGGGTSELLDLTDRVYPRTGGGTT